MMSLKIQLFSFLFSFVFGLFFSLLIKINYRFLFMGKRWAMVIGDFIFLLSMSILYFLGIKFINEGVVHIYFFILFILGWYVGYLLLDRICGK